MTILPKYFDFLASMKITTILAFAIGLSFPSVGQVNPVIIELFTSQGCSSCPAADKNLTEIIKKAEAEGKPVYGLSFHVDYWNYIGWKDPYSVSMPVTAEALRTG